MGHRRITLFIFVLCIWYHSDNIFGHNVNSLNIQYFGCNALIATIQLLWYYTWKSSAPRRFRGSGFVVWQPCILFLCQDGDVAPTYKFLRHTWCLLRHPCTCCTIMVQDGPFWFLDEPWYPLVIDLHLWWPLLVNVGGASSVQFPHSKIISAFSFQTKP